MCLFPFIFYFFLVSFLLTSFVSLWEGFFSLACVAVCAGGTSFGVTSQTFAMSQCCWMASCRKEKRTKRGNEDFLGEINVLLHNKRKNTILFFLVLYKCNYRNHVNTNKKSRTTDRTSHDKDYTLLTYTCLCKLLNICSCTLILHSD